MNKSMPVRRFPRNFEAGVLLENFFISAVSSVLIVRLFLHLTGYPIIGGSGFHIAHMLWGGLIMAASIIISISYLGKAPRRISAIVGGIGFGIFIDELGKFITRDNNYFYQPTIALIYVIFVAMFFLFEYIVKKLEAGDEDYIVNALDAVKEYAITDLDPDEKSEAIKNIEQISVGNPLKKPLLDLLNTISAQKMKPNFWTRWRNEVNTRYKRLIANRKLAKFVITVFLVSSFFNFIPVARTVWVTGDRGFTSWGQFVSVAISLLFIFRGVIRLRSNKNSAKAYADFKKAILVSILLTQFFVYIEEQLSATFSLIINLFILNIVEQLEAKEPRVSAL